MLDWVSIQQDNDDFYFYYRNYTPVGVLPLRAALDTVSYIQKNYPPPYTLMLSGGVDSQAMLYAWLISKCPFNTFSGRYNNNANYEDLKNLNIFAKNYDISINYVDIDIINFFQTDYVGYVEKYRCGSPHMMAFIKMIEMIKEGTPVLSGNFCTLDMPGKQIVDQNNFVLYRYAIQNNRPLVPFFFSETRELYYSFYEQERKYITTKNFNKTDPVPLYNNKVQIYQRHKFPVIPQKIKMTGFESIKDYYDQHYAHLVSTQDKMLRTYRQTSYRTFDLLLRNKYELKYQADKYLYRKIEN